MKCVYVAYYNCKKEKDNWIISILKIKIWILNEGVEGVCSYKKDLQSIIA